MRLSFGQQMQMAQKQVLAPRMIQSMEILQLPIIALQERIEQEMEDNPVLDQVEPTGDSETAANEQVSPDAPSEAERELVVQDDTNNEEDFERLINMADNLPDDYEERSRPSSGQLDSEADRRHDAMANMVSRPESLLDYLQHQLTWYDLDDDLRRMCERVIYNLDSNGYLKSSLTELAFPAPPELNGSTEDWQTAQLKLAEAALAIVQRLDPPGVGARSLKECLSLQLTPGLLFYEELQVLIEDHLEDLESNRLPQISKKTGFSLETITEAWEDLRTLKPKPGSEFNDNFAPSVTPDIYIDRLEAGGYEVRLEDGDLPSLYISPSHRRMLQQAVATGDKETCEYIKKKINSAQWLIEAIEQRRSTLTRVSQAIVDHQRKFLDQGPEHIEPLKMQQVADKVGVHVTTVSRAVDDKWMATPRGIFPLKRFFVGGTTGADGEEVAWDKVRLKLQEVVDAEDKSKPLSDDALVVELAKHGIKVARRTVTKYRKAMNIPSSRQRRDWTAPQG